MKRIEYVESILKLTLHIAYTICQTYSKINVAYNIYNDLSDLCMSLLMFHEMSSLQFSHVIHTRIIMSLFSIDMGYFVVDYCIYDSLFYINVHYTFMHATLKTQSFGS